MTKDGSNARKRAARELAAEQIPYTEALRRIDHGAAHSPACEHDGGREGALPSPIRTPVLTVPRVGPPAATLTPDAALLGHTGYVASVVFHPNGRTLASGGDVTARLWDLHAGQSVNALTLDTRVASVALSPDGQYLAVGSEQGAVHVWSIATGQVTALTVGSGVVRALAYSPDASTLAASCDGPMPPRRSPASAPQRPTPEIRLWNTATGTVAALSREGSYGHALAFHPDGHVLASGGGLDGSISLWDTDTGSSSTVHTGHASGIEALTFSPDGSTLATGSADMTLRLLDVASGHSIATLDPHGGYVTAVAFSPDGRILASGTRDSTVRLWNPDTGQVTATLLGHTEHITSLAFSPDGRTLASASPDATIRLWTVP